jgi:hypothetical protein
MAHFRMAPHACQRKSISVSNKSHRYRRRYKRRVRLKADTTENARAKAVRIDTSVVSGFSRTRDGLEDARAKAGSNRYVGSVRFSRTRDGPEDACAKAGSNRYVGSVRL